METELKIRDLVPMDRCDRCRAPATVAYTLEYGGELLFCTHHATKIPKEVTEHWAVTGAGNFEDQPE